MSIRRKTTYNLATIAIPQASFVDRIFTAAKRAAPLFRLASEYTAAHMTARLLAAISGLLLVRLLPVEEYGLYTLVLAAFTFICTFSDLGATESLSFFRRRANLKQNRSWQQYFYAVLRFRRIVFVIGFISSSVYVFYTAKHIGSGSHTIIFAIVLMGIAALLSINSSIISYVLKLEQRFRFAYAVELSNESTKLVVVAMIWAFGFTSALAGMTSIALGALVAAFLATRFHEGYKEQKSNTGIRATNLGNRALLGQVLPILPGTIHYSIQGPLIAWLAAYYGSVANLAEIGALGRLGVLIGVISGFTATVFVPRLIVIKDETLFIKRYLYWWLVMLAFGGSVMLVVSFFPETLLLLLGSSYSGLHAELVITALSAVIATWGAFAWHINRARGWVRYQPYRVPIIVAGQIPMLYLLDLSTTQGVLLFGLGTIALDVIFQTLINATGFIFHKKAPSNNE